METIRSRIAARALAPGDRVPSIRSLAASLSVSPSTVVEAYDRLAADGTIISRPGSGFYVSSGTQPFALANVGPRRDRAVDPLWVSRQSLDAAPSVIRPGCGWLPPDWLPQDSLRKAIRAAARSDAVILSDYGSARGLSALRGHLSRQFQSEGLNASPDQILLTPSGSQSIDLICRFLLRPGDTVLVDDPCYFNFHAVLRAHQVKVVSVPYTATGPDADAFSKVLLEAAPRVYLTNSALHNPTGATMTPQVAHRILSAATAHDVIIVEDDIFAGFEPELSARLATLDGLARVIRIGSFSKILSPAMRCGYIAARPDWIEALTDLQIATNFGGPDALVTEIVHAALTDSSYRRNVETLRRRLSAARSTVAARLEPLGIRPKLMPRGGFYLWCQLPGGLDAADVARRALERSIVLAPGNVFSVSESATDWMRFNVSQMSDPLVFEVLQEVTGVGHLGPRSSE
ncbi:aminotransferase class I/II-fold pyridoxal phosphate-dependent enzyme [Paracoccus sp. DK608]|uniref:Aminotransferase class I/II-fold pyridoxal phosphate-dependent enzyme n=2 Tax=Paracoccus shanxieyensis TaxID=2675752 RepID=A0A6L6J1T1_9RHOB|nr:aminotransferase class I/II-fold pyridoxal phosphate-dependent enzyme [Paracoccus shanxieyensis]MTH89950.1 aminotransferase class I/II-fold pyridoxal phosphate-dependent enzyme [Paracoccus shanxieyensis]